MILLIISTLLVLGAIALYFLKINNKLQILGGIVLTILIINLTNEFSSSEQTYEMIIQNQNIKYRSNLNKLDISTLTINNKQQQDKQNIVTYNFITKQIKDNKYFLVRYHSIEEIQSEIVTAQTLLFLRQSNLNKQVNGYLLNYKKQYCNYKCLISTQQKQDQDFNMYFITGLTSTKQLNILYDFYFSKNISIIFLTQYPPIYHKINKYITTLKYQFDQLSQNNKQRYQNNPQQIYSNYSSIQIEKQNYQLKCLHYLNKINNDYIPTSWLNICLNNQKHFENQQNGWISLKSITNKIKNNNSKYTWQY